jgi:hypothetical protein
MAQVSTVHGRLGRPVALAVQPVPSASGIDVRNTAVVALTLAPPPITCFGVGHRAVTDLSPIVEDELVACTYSTERT